LHWYKVAKIVAILGLPNLSKELQLGFKSSPIGKKMPNLVTLFKKLMMVWLEMLKRLLPTNRFTCLLLPDLSSKMRQAR
jgi:hypothetical protein